ncbi:FecR domain-containing protein [Flavivirga abyssicola]|uniref:FecR family protein n=1 Tax=Flavivirga abyssicola TaxID=3063533 RepID=UPI0026DFB534|nr:FecR family protein [Flavivirga sp. MEBiC07777]WVK14753.1 FecR domain-containing protein [Flavivirga sp. MEBiC07777]
MDSTKTAIIKLRKILDAFFETDKKDPFKKEDVEYLESVISKYELFDTIDSKKGWTKFEQKIEASQSTLQKPHLRVYRSFLKYAAIAIGVSFAVFFFKKDQAIKNNTPLVETHKSQETVTLNTLGGISKNLDISKKDTITNANGQIIAIQNGKEIFYNTITHTPQKENLIHVLEVPNGKTFKIVLSDGTKVYCDAGTRLQFPVKFPEQGERRISLSGQAFFDVVSDAKNPFIVNTKNMVVHVLGTQFNMSAYNNSNNTQTTLVEGLIKIHLKNTNASKLISLLPGQMAIYNEQSKRMHIKTVNTYDYTAWMSKKLVFKETSFSSILKILERKFNVTIINQNNTIGHEVFTAKFTNETLEQILNTFKIDNDLSYTIKNDQVIIR